MRTLFRFMRSLAISTVLIAFVSLCAAGHAAASPADLLPDLPLSTGSGSVTAQTGFPLDTAPDQAATSTTEDSGIRGMLKGSLLGKLFFNEPFERASLVDIIAILFLAFIVSKIISRPGARSMNGDEDDDSPWGPREEKKPGPAAPPPGFDPWARLRGNPDKKTKQGKTIPFPGTQPPREHPAPEAYTPDSAQPATQADPYLPDPDDDEFLKGAKLIYVRLHEAWKKQELGFIEHFTSPHIYQQYLKMDKDDYLDIVKVDARVIKEGSRNGDPFVTVEFTALAHKSKQAGPPAEIKDTWSFLEPASTGSWRLEEKN
jgi:Uncharacterized protein conserved in bacteria